MASTIETSGADFKRFCRRNRGLADEPREKQRIAREVPPRRAISTGSPGTAR